MRDYLDTRPRVDAGEVNLFEYSGPNVLFAESELVDWLRNTDRDIIRDTMFDAMGLEFGEYRGREVPVRSAERCDVERHAPRRQFTVRGMMDACMAAGTGDDFKYLGEITGMILVADREQCARHPGPASSEFDDTDFGRVVKDEGKFIFKDMAGFFSEHGNYCESEFRAGIEAALDGIEIPGGEAWAMFGSDTQEPEDFEPMPAVKFFGELELKWVPGRDPERQPIPDGVGPDIENHGGHDLEDDDLGF